MSRIKTGDNRIIAEETTTLPEGTVLSVYLVSGKVKKMMLVAMHHNMKRIDMQVDRISPQNMRVYLQMITRDIARRRAALTAKPAMDQVEPHTMEQFVLSMAFNGMFILEPWSGNIQLQEQESLNADSPKPVKKVVSRRRKTKKRAQVLSNNNGTVSGSGAAATDS